MQTVDIQQYKFNRVMRGVMSDIYIKAMNKCTHTSDKTSINHCNEMQGLNNRKPP